MPRGKKLTLDDISIDQAFEVFKRHGLNVRVDAVTPEVEKPSLADFLEPSVGQPAPLTQQVSSKKVSIVLHTQHTIASGGSLVIKANGDKVAEGSIMQSYGPGAVTVDNETAKYLLHQDALAVQTERNLHNANMVTRLITPSATGGYVTKKISEDSGFDLSGFLGQLDRRFSV